MAANSWPEVQQARTEKRHELVLSGADVTQRIDDGGLDKSLFSLVGLNFLEISKTSLSCVPDEIGKLTSLQNLILHSNKLTEVSPAIKSLTQLKLLDLSRNELEEIPAEIGQLPQLHSLNVSSNKLGSFPDVSGMSQLHILDVSHNELESLPEGITSPGLTLLAQVTANANNLQEIPAEISNLASLKTFDVSDNRLTHIPAELSECFKLKEFKYGGNKLKDRRLAKMMDQCTTKSVMDYLRGILQKERQKQGSGGGGGAKDKKKKKKKKGGGDEVDDIAHNLMKVLHFNDDSGYSISVTPQALLIRPYIVCCIVRNLDFYKSKNIFKRFINLQTKLHDTVCQKRQAATIATHDLQSLKWPLKYHAKKPPNIKITPLFKTKEVTADKLVAKLRQEAEEVRKEKKRNTFSGIHKYLDLLKDKPAYPCLLGSEDTVLSLPPITNSDLTKVSKDKTTNILVEVTSSASLDVCKKVLDQLLQGLLELGLGSMDAIPSRKADEKDSSAAAAAATGDDSAAAASQEEADVHAQLGGDFEMAPLEEGQHLVVEQVRIVDPEGTLKVVYPSRVDLQSEAFQVLRD